MENLSPIIKFLQFVDGNEEIWNNYYPPIPKGTIVVYEKDDDIWMKLGNGQQQFQDLPVFMKFSRIEGASLIYYFDPEILEDSSINKLLFLDNDKKTKVTDITYDDILNLLVLIDPNSINALVSKPIIIGQKIKKIGTDIVLKASESRSVYSKIGIKIQKYIWTLPDNSEAEGEEIVYSIPNDISMIGFNILFRCKAIDDLGNESPEAFFEVYLSDMENGPVITDYEWEENN